MVLPAGYVPPRGCSSLGFLRGTTKSILSSGFCIADLGATFSIRSAPGSLRARARACSARWDERLKHITVPLLKKLAVHYRRPQIEYPDLVVLNSGYWDLRRYTEGTCSSGTPSRGKREGGGGAGTANPS